MYCMICSFGLSDLHGDGRVHDVSGPETPSGFGFELTFRLKRESGETAPPTWPAAVMQALAKYVFQSGMCSSQVCVPVRYACTSNALVSFSRLLYRSIIHGHI